MYRRNLVRCLPQTWRNLWMGPLTSARLELFGPAGAPGRLAECTRMRLSTSRGCGPRGPTVSWGSSPGTTRFSPEKEKKRKEKKPPESLAASPERFSKTKACAAVRRLHHLRRWGGPSPPWPLAFWSHQGGERRGRNTCRGHNPGNTSH